MNTTLADSPLFAERHGRKGITMSITVSLVELISWILTVISIVLFILERRKNVRLPYYMAIQGILRACREKAQFYASHLGEIERRDDSRSISKEEYRLLTQTAYTDYTSLMEHIMGSLKAIMPEKDIPFDAKQFTKRLREAKELPTDP
jgi:hypothetical protein